MLDGNLEANTATTALVRRIMARYCQKLNNPDFPNDATQIDVAELTSLINDEHAIALQEPLIDGLPQDWIPSLKTKYEANFVRSLGRTLLPQVIDAGLTAKLLESTCIFASAKRFIDRSGVVVAGFGSKEIFPTVVAHDVQRVMNNKVIYVQSLDSTLSFFEEARIIPFAQDDGVSPIVWGSSHEYEQSIRGQVDTMMNDIPNTIIQVIGQIPGFTLDQATKQALEASLHQGCTALKQQLWQKVFDFKKKIFDEQILESLAILPKDELATVAEAMVSMTALRRKISQDPESVGGPVDVALISKGDGFVWVKRKHYFDPKLNPQFFTRYSR